MRQLDLFGSFFDTPAKEEKPEYIHTLLKKEDIDEVIVNKEIPPLLVDLNPQMPGAEVLKESTEIIESTGQSLEAGEHAECGKYFSFPENIDQEIHPALATKEEPAVNSPIHETDVEQPIIFQAQKELNADQFDENEEAEFEEEKILVEAEKESVLSIADIRVNLKKGLQKRGRKSLEEMEAEVDLIEVPEDEALFKKQYYPISEVARWFRVNASLLRFWEKEFDILKPKKNGKGDRLFRPEDVKNLQLIYQLLRQRKYTIEGAREYIKTNKKKADAEMQLVNTLQKFKGFLLDLKANL